MTETYVYLPQLSDREAEVFAAWQEALLATSVPTEQKLGMADAVRLLMPIIDRVFPELELLEAAKLGVRLVDIAVAAMAEADALEATEPGGRA